MQLNHTRRVLGKRSNKHLYTPWIYSSLALILQVYNVQKSSEFSLLLRHWRILSSFDHGRARTPDVISYTTPKGIENFADEGLVSISGATVVYGPYSDIPSSASDDFIHKHQQPITVHYHHDQPVLEVLQLKRSVEISHWGANLNTQNEIVLYNAGPS